MSPFDHYLHRSNPDRPTTPLILRRHRDIIQPMPYLIDGNNLMHAIVEFDLRMDRVGLCRLFTPIIEQREQVHIVFDGPTPPRTHVLAMERTGVEVTFSHHRTADEIIIERLTKTSTPKKLVVVSTDREIRQAASRRKCRAITSGQFADQLVVMHQSDRTPPDEAPKSENLLAKTASEPSETDEWLREFGFDDETEIDQTPPDEPTKPVDLPDKPDKTAPESSETDEWLSEFGFDDEDEPFDGYVDF